ncbi:MAG: helix-turn-helix domain-containing protein [Caldilineaceae bacterium]
MIALMRASNSQPTRFGEYLRFLRRRARLTQAELSIAVGYSPGQISMLENGQRHPDPTTIAALFVVALGIEKDREASKQLVALAQTAALAAREDGSANKAQFPHGEADEVVVEQMILRQQEELGYLEQVPPPPAYWVERPKPLTQLQQWFAHEQAVAICGMAGMGKSSLAAHFAADYERRHPVLWHTLDEGATLAPEALLRQFALFIIANTDTPTRTAPFLRRFASNEPTVSFHQQLSLVASGLSELDAPLLVLDDAHRLHAAPQTLQTVRRLLTLVPQCRFLFVTRQEMDLPGVLHLMLAGMETGEADQLLKKLGSATVATDQTKLALCPDLDALISQTGGSPMLLRLAASHMRQAPTPGALVSSPATAQSFGRYLVETVLNSLDPAARHLLEFLAIWRSALDLKQSQLGELLHGEWQEYDHRAALSQLQRSRLIDRLDHAIPHPLLREPILSELRQRPLVERRLHKLAAQWSLHLNQASEAAYHFAHAGELEQACSLLTAQEVENFQLGQGVSTAAVVDEVLVLARTQFSYTKETHISDLIRQLLILRGDLLLNTTQADQARDNYMEALSLTTRNIDRARLAEKMAMSAYRQSDLEEALDLCEQATEMLGANVTQEGIRQRIKIETTRMRVLMTLTRFDEARQICERALSMVRPVALILPHLADTVRANANLALGYIATFEGEMEIARQYFSKSVKHAHSAKAASVEADALIYLSTTLRDLGDFAGSEATGQQALTIVQATGNEYATSTVLHYLSLADYYHNNLERSFQRTEQVLALKEPMGDIEGIVANRLVRSLVLGGQGKVEDARQCVLQAAQSCALLENSWLVGLADYGVGVVLSFTGELAEAEQRLQNALNTKELRLDRPFYSSAEIYMAMIYVGQGRLTEADIILQRPLHPKVGYSTTMLRELVRGMWLLAKGEAAAAKECATHLVERATACGFRIYASEASRLAALPHCPTNLAALPGQVCCGVVQEQGDKMTR